MDTLLVFAPVAKKFFGSDGLSLSAANATKNDNSNLAEQLLSRFEKPVYDSVISVIGANGATTEKVRADKLSPADFQVLKQVSELYSQNSVLGQAIRLSKEIERLINQMGDVEVIDLFNLEVKDTPPFPPRPTDLLKINLEQYMDLDSIESMIANAGLRVLDKLHGADIRYALKNEAKAAVLGKQLTKKESFLKTLLRAATEIINTERETNFGLVVKKLVLAYNPTEIEQFKATQQDLYRQYTAVQSQVNGYKKTIKDVVRDLNQQDEVAYQQLLAQHKVAETESVNSWIAATAKVRELKGKALQELAQSKIIV